MCIHRCVNERAELLHRHHWLITQVEITFLEQHSGIQVRECIYCRAVPVFPRIAPATEEGAPFKILVGSP